MELDQPDESAERPKIAEVVLAQVQLLDLGEALQTLDALDPLAAVAVVAEIESLNGAGSFTVEGSFELEGLGNPLSKKRIRDVDEPTAPTLLGLPPTTALALLRESALVPPQATRTRTKPHRVLNARPG